jgi:hypothetical protein
MPFVLQPWHLLACIVAGYASCDRHRPTVALTRFAGERAA